MIILPSAYLPSIEYLHHIASGDYVIDLGENYLKRSPRNRTTIMTANGLLNLTVNIQNANTPRTPISNIKIDYSKNWQHQHWIAIISAYKASPFFEHYAQYLEPFYAQRYESLVEYNCELTSLILKLIGLEPKLKLSMEYIHPQPGDIDLRAKHYESNFAQLQKPYTQVFYDRFPFECNISILDLLLCEGTAAMGYL